MASLSKNIACLSVDVRTILQLLTQCPASASPSEDDSPTMYTRERNFSYTPGMSPRPRPKLHRDSVSSAPGLTSGVVGILKSSDDRTTPPAQNRVDFYTAPDSIEPTSATEGNECLHSVLLRQFSGDGGTSPITSTPSSGGVMETCFSENVGVARGGPINTCYHGDAESSEMEKLGQKISSSDSGMDSPKGWHNARHGPVTLMTPTTVATATQQRTPSSRHSGDGGAASVHDVESGHKVAHQQPHFLSTDL